MNAIYCQTSVNLQSFLSLAYTQMLPTGVTSPQHEVKVEGEQRLVIVTVPYYVLCHMCVQ